MHHGVTSDITQSFTTTVESVSCTGEVMTTPGESWSALVLRVHYGDARQTDRQFSVSKHYTIVILRAAIIAAGR